jgi:DNA-directed RNA polymerase I subunit RPA1
MDIRKDRHTKANKDTDSGEDEDQDDLMRRRDAYVRCCIRKAQTQNKSESLFHGGKDPLAAEQRRAIVKAFFNDILNVKKCAACVG